MISMLRFTVSVGLPLLVMAASPGGKPQEPTAEYLLGPDDQLKIWALGVEEIAKEPYRISPSGNIDLPVIGRVKAGGLTLEQFRTQLLEKLSAEVRQPQVSVDILEFGSQPVSVVGAVTTPGVHQLHGRRTLAEVLAMAGGLKPEAGPSVKIVRRAEQKPIPLPNAKLDSSGEFLVAEIRIRDFMGATNPSENILIQPHDVITVPRAELIYVIGEVHKPGGFPLVERDRISVLQALSLAEGLGSTAAPKSAKILRTVPDNPKRVELAINLKDLLAGKAEDIDLKPNDVLFVPSSTSKRVATRTLEAAISTLSGVIIWRAPR